MAVNSYPEGNRNLLILGSVLPEVMYYTKDHPFEFEEIHEGGDKVYQYLRSKNPELADLGLGMLAHSVKAGADKFNFDENLAILGYEGDRVDELRNRLSEILGIPYETAKTRAHNILELAVELKIIKESPDFVAEFNQTLADEELREHVIRVLSECFNKSRGQVGKSINELLEKAKPGYFRDAEGLASLWGKLSKELDPPPNQNRLAGFLRELSDGFSGKDEVFLRKCIEWTKGNIETISGHPERK